MPRTSVYESVNTPCQADILEPGLRRRRGLPLRLLYAAYHAAVTMVLIGVVGPWMRELYETIDVPMPRVGVAVFELTQSFVQSWPVWPALAAFTLWHFWRRGFDRRLAMACAIAVCTFWLIYVVGLFMPLLACMWPPR